MPTAMPTRASDLYNRLRADLLTARLLPGQRLRIGELMDLYQAGQTPMREALNRLSTEGLVECRDQRGFSAAPVSRSELEELTRTRCAVEALALREAVRRATPQWEERLVLDLHRLNRTDRSLDPSRFESNPEWEDLHRAFHADLLQPCGMPMLADFCDHLADRWARYRQFAASSPVPGRDVRAEHTQILDAVLDRDADRAAEVLQAHYRSTFNLILRDPALLGSDFRDVS